MSMFPRIYSVISLSFFLLLFCSCNSGSEKVQQDFFKDCAAGVPKPIFSPDLSTVKTHQFELLTKEARESLEFENGQKLAIFQTGCEKAKQEFQFTLPGNHRGKKGADWALEAAAQFKYMSQASTQHASFAAWSEMFEGLKEVLIVGDENELPGGFKVKMDPIVSAEQAILVILLFQ